MGLDNSCGNVIFETKFLVPRSALYMKLFAQIQRVTHPNVRYYQSMRKLSDKVTLSLLVHMG